jgi:hypothetical protein
MPETKKKALSRAKRIGFPKSSVVKSKRGGHYIAPRGVTTRAGKQAYAESRSHGVSKAKSARISHYVDKIAKAKHRKSRK